MNIQYLHILIKQLNCELPKNHQFIIDAIRFIKRKYDACNLQYDQYFADLISLLIEAKKQIASEIIQILK